MGELAVTRDPARADDSFDSVGRDRLPDASAAVRIASRRDRFNGWFVAHEVAWELLMAALAIVYARALRLLRLLRLVRAFAGVYRAALHIGALARHRGFAWLIAAWLGVMAVCSATMYVAEKGANSAIANPFDALWWGVVTLTTVGYGDVYPTTTEGRLAAMVLMLLGIGLFGAITATITSYMMTRDQSDPAPSAGPPATGDTAVERTASAGGSLVADLERLAALHRSGDLTAVEFERAKARLLEAAS